MVKINNKAVFEYGGKTIIDLIDDSNLLITANKNGLVKIFKVDSPQDEPDIIDIAKDIASLNHIKNDKILITTMNGDCFLYTFNVEGLDSNRTESAQISEIDTNNWNSTSSGNIGKTANSDPKQQLLMRSGLPLRDSVVVYSGNTAVLGGDDLELVFINLLDKSKKTIKLIDQVSQLSFSSKTNLLAVSFVNGSVQFFSLNSTEPNKVKQLDGFIVKNYYNDDFRDELLNKITNDSITDDDDSDDDEDDDEEFKVKSEECCPENRITTRVAWHPSGLYFALPCHDGTVKIFTLKDYKVVKTLKVSNDSVINKFIDLKFDNLHGNFIAAVDLNNKLTIWDWNNSSIEYQKTFKLTFTNFVWKFNKDRKTLNLILGSWSGHLTNVDHVLESVQLKQGSVNSKSNDSNDMNKSNGLRGLFVGSDDESDADNGKNIKNDGLLDNVADEDLANMNDDIDSDNIFTQERAESKKRQFDNGMNDDDDDAGLFSEDDNGDNFIEDDDGAGYVTNKKVRYNNPIQPNLSKSFSNSSYNSIPANSFKFKYKPLSPGATPFGNEDRRYLTMNRIGHVLTVVNNEQHLITVTFHDRGKYTEYHFEDLFGYDVCYLYENGILLAQSKTGQIYYRPHENVMSDLSWTKYVPLDQNEIITSIALTPNRVIIGTSFGYIRIFNQFGVPLSIEKMSPIVALAVFDYRIFTVHYSNFHGLTFSLFENSPKKVRYFHRESILPINQLYDSHGNGNSNDLEFAKFNPVGIKNLFFSEFGDPCIYGADNILMILNKWRSPMESRWVPIFDSKMEMWRMTGGKNDRYIWPLGLNFDILSCILLKGKVPWPQSPVGTPDEFKCQIPVLVKKQLWDAYMAKKNARENQILTNDNEDEDELMDEEMNKKIEIDVPVEAAAEENYLRSKLLSDLLSDTLNNDGEMYGNENELLYELQSSYDKSILRLFALACSQNEIQKALSMAQELKQDKALNAASRIAERAELPLLTKKLNAMREALFARDLENN